MERLLRTGAYWRSLMLPVLLLAPVGPALAADNGLYVGLATSAVSSDYDLGAFGAGGADDDRGFKAIVGVRPFDSFAIEANYVDMGDTRVPLSIACITAPCPTQASIDSQALSVSAVGLLALPLVDLYARVGYASWESERSSFAPQKRDGRDPTYGAGAQLRVGSFALRLEYERFKLDRDSSDLMSIGFTYTFL